VLISRPLSTSKIKKMFLIVLNEHKPGLEYSGKEKDSRVIVYDRIAEYFKISDLTVHEFRLGLMAVELLEKEGYIMQDSLENSEFFKQLTDKGNEYVNKELNGKKIPVINYDQLQEKRIEEVVTRFDLRERVLEDYYEGNYEGAIMKAFDLIEEKIKEKLRTTEGTGASEEIFLNMPKPSNEQIDTELKILRIKMFGAVMWFRDKKRDITSGVNDAEVAAQILGYANMHLKLIDECEYFT
jgi:hypothetical protein